MPRHRSLTLEKLVSAINPELMERYFTEKMPPGTQLPLRFVMSPQAVGVFMDDPCNAGAKELVMEDLRTINDICEKAMNHVVRAYQQYDIVKGGEKVRRVADQNCGTPVLCTPYNTGRQLFPIHFFNVSSGPGSSGFTDPVSSGFEPPGWSRCFDSRSR